MHSDFGQNWKTMPNPTRESRHFYAHWEQNTGCGISRLTEYASHADDECKNEAKALIVTC
jgi:hypothetical protein